MGNAFSVRESRVTDATKEEGSLTFKRIEEFL